MRAVDPVERGQRALGERRAACRREHEACARRRDDEMGWIKVDREGGVAQHAGPKERRRCAQLIAPEQRLTSAHAQPSDWQAAVTVKARRARRVEVRDDAKAVERVRAHLATTRAQQ